MNHRIRPFALFAPAATCALAGLAAAQSAEGLISFSQPEQTLSSSGGTVLQNLRPNETALLQWGTTAGCANLSAEKWLPRTCSHVMAGDENADGTYFNPAVFGSIDALVDTIPMNPIGVQNQRTVFWSVASAMGNAISANPFRPGDVARIVRQGFVDGQVEYFMRQEQFNQALGLPLATPIDVDAIAFSPQFGVFFSLDGNQLCNTACGPVFVQDGDVIVVPPMALTYTVDMRIASVLPNSALVVIPEATLDLMVANAQVTDRFGACLTAAGDLEALEFDPNGPMGTYGGCTAGMVVIAPSLIFAVENGTGASLLTTAGGGQIWNGPCSPMGRSCGSGPTLGMQAGVRPVSGNIGAPSHVNAFALVHTNRYVLEPQNHVLPVWPLGAPAGATSIDVGSPFAWNLVFVEIVPPVIPGSLPAFPFSQFFFPDVYVPSLNFYLPTPSPFGWGSFPMPAIPAGWQGKVLFQSVGFSAMGTLELSTPTVVDVQ